MAADTAAKRYSAMNIANPWRGCCVVPDGAIPHGERKTVMFFYHGIALGGVVSVDFAGKLHRPVEVWLVRTVT